MQTELKRLFYNSVEAYGASVSLPVAFPNVTFNPAKDVPGDFYLMAAALPAEPSVHGVDKGESTYIWVLQVSVYARDGVGEVNEFDSSAPSISDYVDDLRTSIFPVYSELTGPNHTFKVMTPPTPRPSLPSDGWYSIPVRFEIQTIA